MIPDGGGGTPAGEGTDPEAPPGHLTLWLTNSGLKAKQLTIDLGLHSELSGRLTGLLYDAASGHDYQSLKFESNEDLLTCSLPPRCVAALTTLEEAGSADLSAPLKLSPKLLEPTYRSFDLGGFRRELAHFSFEEPVDWEIWRSSPGKSVLERTDHDARHGKASCAIRYEFVSTRTSGREEHLVASTTLDLAALPLEAALRIRGDAAGHVMSLIFLDEQGETFECPNWITIDWEGWRDKSVSFAGMPKKWTHWGARSDGVLDFPLRGFGLIFRETKKGYKGQGLVLLDEVRILAKPVLPASPATPAAQPNDE